MRVDAQTNILDGGFVTAEVTEGQSVYEILGGDLPGTRVFVGGHEMPRELWRIARPKIGSRVVIYQVPQGGDSGILRAVAAVVIAVASAYTGGLVGAAYGTAWGAAAGAGVAIAGQLAVNALIPPQTPDLGGSQDQPDRGHTITGGRNQANKYGVLPRPYGEVRWYPPLAANYFTEAAGDDQYLYMLVCLGYGAYQFGNQFAGPGRSKITSLPNGVATIGETELNSFDGVSYEIGTQDQITLYSRDIEEIRPAANLDLQSSSGEGSWFADGVDAVRTTEPNTDVISVDLTFPKGLQTSGSDGNEQRASIEVEIDYRPSGGGSWTNVVDTIITRNTRDLFRRNFRWSVSRGQYDVRVTRVRTYLPDRELVLAALQWSALRSIRRETPFDQPDCTVMALRIKATDQLEGVIDQLRIRQTSILPVWDGNSFSDQVTRNPAWAYVDSMRGIQVRRPIPISRIDMSAIKEWADWSDNNQWTYDFVHDNDETLPERLQNIASAGLASFSPNMAGKIGVIREKDEDPIHMITPRNSWGFSATKAFSKMPHALKVRFISGDTWQEDTRIVYDDGFNSSNATRFEEIKVNGITNSGLAWRYGRRHLAQIQLRPETYTVSMDFENARFRRGDTVLLANDVMLVGSGSGRIMRINGNDVLLDQDIVLEGGKNYVARVQVSDNGNLELRTVTTGAGLYNEITLADVSGIAEGDLVTIGESTRETLECKVAGITYSPNLDAQITLVDRAPGILQADSEQIPDYDPHITEPVPIEEVRPAPPVIDVARSDGTTLQITDDGFQPGLLVGWTTESGRMPIDQIELRYRTGEEWTAQTHPSSRRAGVITGLKARQTAHIQIRARSIWGTWSRWSASATVTVEGVGGDPQDVTGFDLVAQGDQAILSWDRAPDLDVRTGGRVLLYHGSSANIENATPLDRLPGNATIGNVPLLSGYYLAVFEDSGGRQSPNPAIILTSAPQATKYNAVATYSEPPVNGTIISGLSITPDNYLELTASEGTYETGTVVDLGAIYTSRVWSEVITSTYLVSDLLSNRGLISTWDSISGAGQIKGPTARAYIRITEDDPSGTPTWSDWQRLTVGVYKARAYQVRIVLTRQNNDQGIRLQHWALNVDMPDRMETDDNVSVGSGGASIAFSPAFHTSPKVGITIEDAQSGDYYRRTNTTRTGFDVQIFNSTDTAVARTIDWYARGYGYEETP